MFVGQKKFKVVGMLSCISGIASTVWVMNLIDKRIIIVKNNANDTHTCLPNTNLSLHVTRRCYAYNMHLSFNRHHQWHADPPMILSDVNTTSSFDAFHPPTAYSTPEPPLSPSKPEILTTRQDIDVHPLLLVNPSDFDDELMLMGRVQKD